jgi:hypothetical protein
MLSGVSAVWTTKKICGIALLKVRTLQHELEEFDGLKEAQMCYNYKWDAALERPSHWIATVLGVTIVSNDTSSNDSIQIPLTKGHTAIVSPEDADLASFKWFAATDPKTETIYAARRVRKHPKQYQLRMHRIIMERVLDRPLTKDERVDHANHDGRDNRRENLRLATFSQNTQNSRIRSDNKSGYKGVSLSYNKWRVEIAINGRRIRLGTFTDIKDAARAYNAAALLYHGEFACLNEILE